MLARSEFTLRVAITVAIVAGTALLLLAAWASESAILLLFASGLVAVFLRGLSDGLSARTRLAPGAALAVTIGGLAAIAVVLGCLLAPAAIAQASDLARRLPAEIAQLRDEAAATTWGGEWLGVTTTPGPGEPTGAAWLQPALVYGAMTALVGGVARAAVGGVLIAAAGLYFAAQPEIYCEGALRLVPPGARPEARRIAVEVADNLGRWLIGQVVLMAIVTLLTGLGLWALAVPLALILALLRGVLNLIPNVGPVVAMVPGLIIAAGQGESALFRVALMYGVLQLFETYLLTPLVNRRAAHMAPMLTVGAQLVLGAVLGVPGVILAAPLTVVGMVLVQSLYIERVLGEHPDSVTATVRAERTRSVAPVPAPK